MRPRCAADRFTVGSICAIAGNAGGGIALVRGEGLRVESYLCARCGRHWYGEIYRLWNQQRRQSEPVCRKCYNNGKGKLPPSKVVKLGCSVRFWFFANPEYMENKKPEAYGIRGFLGLTLCGEFIHYSG